jgi:hypothetical protein
MTVALRSHRQWLAGVGRLTMPFTSAWLRPIHSGQQAGPNRLLRTLAHPLKCFLSYLEVWGRYSHGIPSVEFHSSGIGSSDSASAQPAAEGPLWPVLGQGPQLLCSAVKSVWWTLLQAAALPASALNYEFNLYTCPGAVGNIVYGFINLLN